MENYLLEDDISVVCITATGFPSGLPAVWQKMFTNFPPAEGRVYYGISYPDPAGKIIYRAAVNESSLKYSDHQGLEIFVIRKGKYISEYIDGFKKDETVIARTFQKLLDSKEIAKDGICLEIYSGENGVRCLVTHK